MCDRPARRAADEAELVLRVEIVNLVDDAIDIERQLVALLADAVVIRQGSLLHRMRRIDQMADRETPVAQFLQRRRVGVRQIATFDDADRIRVERQWPLRRDARIELAQRTCRAIARIGQRFAAILAARASLYFSNSARGM